MPKKKKVKKNTKKIKLKKEKKIKNKIKWISHVKKIGRAHV